MVLQMGRSTFVFSTESWQFKRQVKQIQRIQENTVTLPDGSQYRLSSGPHNEIQKAIIEDFLPRFSKGAQILYIGDTVKKILHMNESQLQAIGIKEMSRDILPDVIAYEQERNWLFLIEAVHSSNPISELRHLALRRLVSDAKAGCIFVSGFANTGMFSKFSKKISWETEVWIAEQPDHMIHFDGEKFLGPYNPQEVTKP